MEKIVEVPVGNKNLEEIQKQEIELESRIKKFDLKEAKLQEELNSVHIKESELLTKEKDLIKESEKLDNYKVYLDERSKEINDKFKDLEPMELELQNRIVNITDKENNLSNYITKDKISESLKKLSNSNNQCQSTSCVQFRNYLSSGFVENLLKS